ncbi:6-hydroxymethylpterin diphosphokinase MptE-like protein [Lysinibacillus capsici]|uniref:motility associated factor glycosyltransferase family protein n=1 Tax=Lysinibacillus capsici TaxID=2115968 RepID=UPI0029DE8C00|nr:6-hydroxymethylpterin diphosphokinase MptE-like protein [Lysinibacillus capsici]WPK06099.1 6-hydroxymethylpterin diphosphokinase MptE-like protein [Lysinibacillus capsici]
MSKYNIEYVSTNNNLKTMRVNNFFLHSKYNPIQEAKRIVEKEFEPNFVHVVFGYGLGYIIDELINKLGKKDKLIVIDPLLKEFNQEIDSDNSSFTLIEEVKSELIEEVVATNLNNLSTQVKIICSPNYDKILKEEYLIVLESIKTVQRLQQVGENTTRQFSLDWQENYVHNILHSYMNHSLKELKQAYNCPIIVISGGPSLKKQILKLKEIKEKIITIASGSTINSLLYHGIEPDYVVSIDGGIANYNHFKEIGNIKSQLIFGFSSHYKIQEIFPNAKYALLDVGDSEFQNYLNNVFSIDVPLIAGGASVANFAFTVACYMTSGPIAIIGQDLAYTNNKSHEDSNKHYIEIDESYKKSRGMFEITGYYNDNVLTDYAFLLMKKDFERLNRQIQHPSPIFNCTEGGAKIEGMEQIPFTLFCDSFINEETNKLNSQSRPPSRDMDFFIDKMQAEIAIYNKIIGEIQIGLAKLNSNKSNIVFEKSVLRELDKIDKSIKKYKIRTAMNHIFDPITMDVLRNYQPVPNESDQATFERVFNQNKELYSRLLEAFKVSKQYVLDVIKTTIK